LTAAAPRAGDDATRRIIALASTISSKTDGSQLVTTMNAVSVSWGDHLSFGEGDGRLDDPDGLRRRLGAWHHELGAGILHWRLLRTRIPGRFAAGRGYAHPSRAAARRVTWNDLDVVPMLAHDAGLEAWLYVTLFDEGWPLRSRRARTVSHHNAMHGQHVAWQSALTRRHPEWVTMDRRGALQWGVPSLAYPEVRRAFIERWMAMITDTAFDGLFVCLRSQSRPADHGDQFGFNRPVRADLLARTGIDIHREGFHLQPWRDLLGEYLTMLLVELRAAVARARLKLGVGAARGDVIGPPLGNATLHWREWLRRGLIDQLVINQNSSQCPSMWHPLWPMHRGTGYVQNYLTGDGLPPLADQLRDAYAPAAAASGTRLLVARQWSERSADDERELAAVPGVTGLVFSSFRHDNPGAIRRGDWRAGAFPRSAPSA
jgi:hypothetical protein